MFARTNIQEASRSPDKTLAAAQLINARAADNLSQAWIFAVIQQSLRSRSQTGTKCVIKQYLKHKNATFPVGCVTFAVKDVSMVALTALSAPDPSACLRWFRGGATASVFITLHWSRSPNRWKINNQRCPATSGKLQPLRENQIVSMMDNGKWQIKLSCKC